MQTTIIKNGIDLRSKIDYTDRKTLEFLANGDYLFSIFQLSSNISRTFLRRALRCLLKKEIITEKDVISLVADCTTMIRPACIESGVPSRYFDRLEGKKVETVLPRENYFYSIVHEATKDTLEEVLYQERIMIILAIYLK